MQQKLIINRLYSVCCLQSVIFCLESCVCRLWSSNGPSTSVENPLQINPLYAKQTQFTKCPNLHKFLLYKGLSKFYPAGGAKKQTQFKPNQTQFQKSQNEYKLNFNKGLQKKR